MNDVAYFEIQAERPERAIRFYSGLFGWQFAKDNGLPIEFWRIAGAGINGALMQRPLVAPTGPAGTNAFVCSIHVQDFDTMAKRILEAGGTIALPKFAVVDICWQGYFIDPEGNTFGLFQPDEGAA